ncbi:MAG: 4Fe-4S binding protein [Piscinibacter sp.]
MARLQRRRRALQLSFFALFLLAPALNLLRFDLHETQLWVLGLRWSLGIDEFVRGEITATQVALNIVLRAIVPAVLLAVAFMTVAYRYGRLYCGWLCPHFSLVESLNGLLQRACGKLSVWDKHVTPRARRRARCTLVADLPSRLRQPRLPVDDHAADLPAAAARDLGQPAARHADAEPGALHRHRQRGVHARADVRAPPVLPLRLRRRPVPEPGLDGQPEGPGGRLRPRTCARLPRLQHRAGAAGLGLRRRLPDAPEPAQHQTHDVLLRAVRSVPDRMRELARAAQQLRPTSNGRSASTRCARRCASAAKADHGRVGRRAVAPLHHAGGRHVVHRRKRSN